MRFDWLVTSGTQHTRSRHRHADMARRFNAVADYVGKSEDELTFLKGDTIFVINREGDRLQGVLRGKVHT